MQSAIRYGVVALIVSYLFVWEPTILFAKGQKVVEFVFSFFRPMVKVAPYVLPIYSLLLFGIYLIISTMTQEVSVFFSLSSARQSLCTLSSAPRLCAGKKGIS